MKQCYPNTALVGVQVDSEQFGSQQVSRNYHLRGRILQVPSNCDTRRRGNTAVSRDGTLKPACSNNMAGVTGYADPSALRHGETSWCGGCGYKWALYVIGQYCDQSVPDGFGGARSRALPVMRT
ncbi:hypothetical protein [Escherichia coli]|uniref:hypothetical protein n=1 Tax=Escherichia coli TaxID=562 RepID=UPI00388E9BDC